MINIRERFRILSRTDITVGSLLFFSAYFLYLTVSILSSSMFNAYNELNTFIKLARYLSYLIIIIKILVERLEDNALWITICIAALLVMAFLANKDRVWFFYFILILGTKNIRPEGILRCTWLSQIICLVTVVLSSYMHFIEDVIYDPTTRVRHSLGFQWTTTPAALFLFSAICYIGFRKKKIHLFELLGIEIIGFYFYKMTDAKLNFIFLSMIVLLGIIMKFKTKNVFLPFPWIYPWIIAAFSFIIHYMFNGNSGFWKRLDAVLSGRLDLGYKAIHEYGISLFGKDIKWVGYNKFAYETGAKYNMVDNSYLQILLKNGLIILVLILALYTMILVIARKKQDEYIFYLTLVILLISILETRLASFEYNPLMFIGMSYIYELLNSSASLRIKRKRRTGERIGDL